jgi:hypothetical protein
MNIRTELFQISFKDNDMGIVVTEALKDFELYHHKVDHHVYKAYEMLLECSFAPKLSPVGRVSSFLDFFFICIKRDNDDIVYTKHRVTQIEDTYVASFFITYKPNEYVQG